MRGPVCGSPLADRIPWSRWMLWWRRSCRASRNCAGCLRRFMSDSLIAVAMSGGVDSSAVAGMLRRRGDNIVGMTMQLWNQRRLPELATEGATGRCCSLDDVYDARYVAQLLG